ncbi:hypothetical protein [Haloferula sargassicola]|uniref:Rhamnan synthesis protein F n=1 Tax=Haloferula sargassicola TaxID=490096 RepID=A0ABP9UKA8_9BACT
MSWTDLFPVFGDEQAEAFASEASPEEQGFLDECFGILKVFNAREGRHLVATSLFWKSRNLEEGPLEVPTRERLMVSKSEGESQGVGAWTCYVKPLLQGARILEKLRPEVVVRVYLAADLEFLVEDLVGAGCEVMLMRGSSLSHNPGAMWRFLAMGEKGRLATITDADRMPEVIHDVERTERVAEGGFGFWRVPYVYGGQGKSDHPGYYRPVLACHFGVVGGLEVERLLRAFVWHTLRGTMPTNCRVGGGSGETELPVFGTKWPDYGFDEWFLLAAVYPRLAFEGTLTFFPKAGTGNLVPNHWFALDVEYVTWANPRSEVIYFGVTDFYEKLAKGPQVAENPARSEVLDEMLREKGRGKLAHFPVVAEASRPATLVVARYMEELDWLGRVPAGITVVVYNKGPRIRGKAALSRIDLLEALPNVGRESDTYLHHLAKHAHDEDEAWTVFAQGDPFSHQPRFIELLERRGAWSDLQPLTAHYLDDNETPPRVLKRLEDDEWVAGIPVRTEPVSAWTLGMLNWRDDDMGYRMFREHAEYYQVPKGWSLSGHFLEMCGLHGLAREAWRASVARFAYGAMFAVKNDRLGRIPHECIPEMRRLAAENWSIGYMFERLWLHIFGLPFPVVGERVETGVVEPF